MNTESAFETSFDARINRLTIQFLGAMDGPKMKQCLDHLEGVVPSLRPEFTLLTDLSGLHSMDLSCLPHLEKIMDLCRENGVSTIVRVVPSSDRDIGFNILSKFHYPSTVRIITCTTLSEAQRAFS
jgi:anti-anti-sigma regulatory factor